MEWRLGWGILKTAMEGFADGSGDAVAQAVAKRFGADEGPFASVYHANVACFTETPDLDATGDWFRRLGKTERIEFDVEEQLVPALRPDRRKLGIRLWPVVYSVDYLLDVATKLIGEVLERAVEQGTQEKNLGETTLSNRAYYALRTPFTLMGLSFKRPKFQAEAEWRIIATGFRPEDEPDASPLPALGRFVELPILGLAEPE